MPHIIVKLWPGKTEEQKLELTDKIVKAVAETMNSTEKSISVSIQEVQSHNWVEEVYIPDILDRKENLYKKPGYNPLHEQTLCDGKIIIEDN